MRPLQNHTLTKTHDLIISTTDLSILRDFAAVSIGAFAVSKSAKYSWEGRNLLIYRTRHPKED